MKKTLLLLLALTVAPAWAADATVAPSKPQPQATQVAPETQSGNSWLNFLIKDSKAGPMSCPAGCAFMNCPPPTGPLECCNMTTYQKC